MIVGVIPNPEKDAGYAYTRVVCAYLEDHGHTPIMEASDASAADWPKAAASSEMVYRNAGFVVVLGGDGTMLRISHVAALYGAEMLGINLGNLGYLTDADRNDGLQALDITLRGEARREKRMMLMIDGERTQNLAHHDKLALNDVYLTRGGFGKMITFHLYINNQYMETLRADGVIVATPTGSTAYNLSAGGPILSPEGDMIVITPICPHALYTRPWVVSGHDVIEIRTAGQAAQAIHVTIDGEPRLTLTPDDTLTIRNSGCDAYILKTSPMNFYDILRTKMGVSQP